MSDAPSSRCVILWHTFSETEQRRVPHWDWMFEFGGALITWETPPLSLWLQRNSPLPPRTIVARRLVDHRLHYLDYSGPLTGNRGHVQQLASGVYQGEPPFGDVPTGQLHLQVLWLPTQQRRKIEVDWQAARLSRDVNNAGQTWSCRWEPADD